MDRSFIHRKENTILKLSQHPEFTEHEFYVRNPNVSIDMISDDLRHTYILQNPNATWEEMKKYYNYSAQSSADLIYLLYQPAITLDIIEEFPGYLNSVHKSRNPNLTIEFVKKHIDKRWDYQVLLIQPFATDELFALVGPRMINKVDFGELTRYNANFRWSMVLQNLTFEWDWQLISRHENITWRIITAHPDMPWFWRNVTQNPNITWDIILQNPEYPWCLEMFALNPNLTFDIITSVPFTVWRQAWLSINHYGYTHIVYTRAIRAYRISRRMTFKKIMYTQNHPIITENIIKMIQHYM